MFHDFKIAVAEQFKKMCSGELFRVAVDRDQMWDQYLASFPRGSNLIYRERTTHDCSACRQFIKRAGNIVAIQNGELVSIWDISIGNGTYKTVADKMAEFIKQTAIENVFREPQTTIGIDKNYEDTGHGIHTWEHLFVNVPTKYVVNPRAIDSELGLIRTRFEVFKRALDEISREAIDIVLDLIRQNSIYRGQENLRTVEHFDRHHRNYHSVNFNGNETKQTFYVWENIQTPPSIAGIRNSSIGTLLVDLSSGMDVEQAVRRFETMVAPANYKRPTALVTKAQVEKARETIRELGLESSLERRYARITDITVNNVIYAGRAVKKLAGDVFDEIAVSATKPVKSFDKIDEISIDKFITDVVPTIQTLEVLFENKHTSRLMSLVTAVEPTASLMFKWSNSFSWSYNGDMADSIKERVKQAGGNVTGDLCCRLAWDYTDDLDFHMHEPKGSHISYMNYRRERSPCGGMLDVDANGCDGVRENPVENIFYAHKSAMIPGTYILSVNNFSRRSDGRGFEIEIEADGQVYNFTYDKVLRSKEYVDVATIYLSNGKFEVTPHIPNTVSSKTVWGLPTQQFHPVTAMMLSPNYWDDQTIGNKHYFFILDGCANDGVARGFFNEFLKEELTPHRKVLEIVGSKMKTEETADQLSGLGFSSTQKDEVTVRVTGGISRVLKIVF